MVPEEEFWYQPKREYVARPQSRSSRGRGRGRGGYGGRSGHNNEQDTMKEDGPCFGANIGDTGRRLLRKRLAVV
jgi:hypothetical protein